MLRSLQSRAVIGSFYQELEMDPGISWVEKLSMYFTSDQESETYAWLGMVPSLRKWVGGRQAKQLRDLDITLVNEVYEATLRIGLDEIRRDKTGQVAIRIAELARNTNRHWAKMLTDLIIAAESTTAYDGQYFFDTDHSEGDSGTQSNDITVDVSDAPVNIKGTYLAPSADVLSHAALSGINQILSLKDDTGQPLNENANEFLVMVPNTFFPAAVAGLKAPNLSQGVTNAMALSGYKADVVANPRLTWTDKFAVFRTDGQVKPFIRQEEYGVQMAAQAEGSSAEFEHREHVYGVDTSRAAGYGLWQHACLVTLVA